MSPAYVIVGVLVFVIVLIALAWLLVLRRLNEGNFEVGGPLHPLTRQREPEPAAVDKQAPVRAWSTKRQREREEHAATNKGLDQARDRNVGRTWGG